MTQTVRQAAPAAEQVVRPWLEGAAHFMRRHFLFFLVGSYVLAALVPAPGHWVGGLGIGAGTVSVSAPMGLLAVLLFLAGLEVPTDGVRQLVRRPAPLALGLLANLVLPVLFIAGVAQLTRPWSGAEGIRPVLVGLGLIAAMPIAGSATAWAQKADGDLGLSLGLVLGSTALSLVTTPLTLYAVSAVALGDDPALRELAGHGSGAFLLLCVVAPSAAGILARRAAGAARIEACHSLLKSVSSVALLLLVYVNAARSLPQALARPDPDLLLALTFVAGSFCAVAFASGWLVARLLRVPPGEQASLIFALGMSNNGTGMVLAAAALADRPEVGLVVVCYNLIQQLVAGGVDFIHSNTPAGSGAGGEAGAGPLRALASFGFVLVAAVVVANASASYWNVRTLADGNRWVVHTHEVISRLQDVVSLLKDAETGQRGYLLTDRDEYLEPYHAAVEKVPGRVEQLRALTADNPEQQARVAELEARINDKLAELREAVSARRERGRDAALSVVLDGRGKRAMDEVRRVAGEMEASEVAALEARAAASDLRVRRTLASIVLTTLVVLVVHVARSLSQFRPRAALARGNG